MHGTYDLSVTVLQPTSTAMPLLSPENESSIILNQKFKEQKGSVRRRKSPYIKRVYGLRKIWRSGSYVFTKRSAKAGRRESVGWTAAWTSCEKGESVAGARLAKRTRRVLSCIRKKFLQNREDKVSAVFYGRTSHTPCCKIEKNNFQRCGYLTELKLVRQIPDYNMH